MKLLILALAAIFSLTAHAQTSAAIASCKKPGIIHIYFNTCNSHAKQDTLRIRDVNGVLVLNRRVTVFPNINKIRLDARLLEPGNYTISISGVFFNSFRLQTT